MKQNVEPLNPTIMKRISNTLAALSVLCLALLAGIFIMLSSFALPEHKPDFKIPQLNTSKNKSPLCLAPQYMLNAWYDIECVKKFCTEFNPDAKCDKKNKYHEFYENPAEAKPQAYSNDGLVLVVDTLQEITMTKRPIWASYLFHHNLGNNSTLLQDDTLIQDVKSFPVFLANTSNDKTANVKTQDGSLMMITEAKDAQGKWRAIEYWSHSWCGNSYFSIDIPAQHFAFTRGIKCSGDFYTSCRLKLFNRRDSLYSNEFKMSISKNQFTKPRLEMER